MGRREEFREAMAVGRILLADGAWGTELQKLGLDTGDCPEAWNVDRPDEIRKLTRAYAEAGADLLMTNTFGGNRFRLRALEHHGKVEAYNRAGAAIAREVADAHGKWVAASVGPTGELIEPRGLASRRQMYEAFREQLEALKAGGVDAVMVETMSDPDEMRVAAQAAKDLELYCFATMTFNPGPDGYRTYTGVTVAEAAQALNESAADAAGTNCGTGLADMLHVVRQMRPLTHKPLLVQANAGLPQTVNGKLVYGDTPAHMAALLPDLIAAGAQVVGGCCGTTPEHVKAFRAVADALNAKRGPAA
ncbi:MAG: hypothetical protein AMXMBFR7_04040 [Planctomycetota bacterium]